MRYSNARKYPITQKKKNISQCQSERIIDLGLGTAAGLLGLVFLEGLILGLIIKRRR
jgi:hypothetical protein